MAGTMLDCLQILPSLIAILLIGRADHLTLMLLVASLPIALLAANLVGVWVAAGARSIAEGALFAAVTALFLLHGSGVFRTPSPGSWQAQLETLLPFAPLHEALFQAAGGNPAVGLDGLWPPFLATSLLTLLTLATARPLLDRITDSMG